MEFIHRALEEPLLVLGLILLLGYAISILLNRIHLPEVTGYIIAGLLFGESVLGIISHEMQEAFVPLTEVALGIIAVTIGAEFLWSKIKRLGVRMVVITIIQVVAAFAAVTVALHLLALPLIVSLLLGAISAATAPAATVAIVQSLRLKGEFVDYLYGVVALDDAATVILFGIVGALAGGVAHGMSGNTVLFAFGEIFFSILVGGVGGLILHISCHRIRESSVLALLAGGMTLLISGLAAALHLSPLLSTMAAGAVLINLTRRNERIIRSLQPYASIIYALFFILAGSELRLAVLIQPETLLLGGVYILARAIGKYGGVYIGAALTKSPPAIRKWLGACMMPQAGVALGLVIVVQNNIASSVPLVSEYLQIITNIVLFSVFINELIGPPLSRFALRRGIKG